MNILGNVIDYEFLQKSFLEKVVCLQQEILQNTPETKQSREVFVKVYERLTDEQKIAFILAGGLPSLFHSHQDHTSQASADADAETGQLPVLC